MLPILHIMCAYCYYSEIDTQSEFVLISRLMIDWLGIFGRSIIIITSLSTPTRKLQTEVHYIYICMYVCHNSNYTYISLTRKTDENGEF